MFSSFSFFVFSSEDQLLSLSQIHPYNLVKLSRIMIQFLKAIYTKIFEESGWDLDLEFFAAAGDTPTNDTSFTFQRGQARVEDIKHNGHGNT